MIFDDVKYFMVTRPVGTCIVNIMHSTDKVIYWYFWGLLASAAEDWWQRICRTQQFPPSKRMV